MSNLSPTAQLVWNAFNDAQICAEVKLAAALRAAADQLREAYVIEAYVDYPDDWLDDIAAELEAHQ